MGPVKIQQGGEGHVKKQVLQSLVISLYILLTGEKEVRTKKIMGERIKTKVKRKNEEEVKDRDEIQKENEKGKEKDTRVREKEEQRITASCYEREKGLVY